MIVFFFVTSPNEWDWSYVAREQRFHLIALEKGKPFVCTHQELSAPDVLLKCALQLAEMDAKNGADPKEGTIHYLQTFLSNDCHVQL